MRRKHRARSPSNESGQRRVHEAFASEILGNERTITVHLPPGYDEEPSRRYPVVYFHDGQNIFDDGRAAFGVSWRAGATTDRLTREGRIPPVLLVGIDNTPARHDEYSFERDDSREEGGRGVLYARFVLEEVKPFIDREYRTWRDRRHTAIVGSSMGGLITLAMARIYHDVFALAGVLSPSLWWANAATLQALEHDHDWMRRMRFWLCVGTREGTARRPFTPHLKRTRQLVATFDQARLVPGRDYYYWEVAGGQHHEAAWAARLDKVLLYFFGW